ncbi:MAG: SRPBCC family protein [Actinomycetes bacterium]|jgi:hypothetical protein
MQEHHYEFEVAATPEEVWEVFWYHGPDKPMTPGVDIQILHPGDAVGEGLVRHCRFPVPKWLGSRGVGRSWEWVTQVQPHRSWKYDAIGKPIWSKAEGFITLEPVGPDRTRIDFVERYEAFNPWMTRLGLERRVHRRISRDNNAFMRAVEGGLKFHRRRKGL